MSELKELFAEAFPTADPTNDARSRVAEMALAADRRTDSSRVRLKWIRRSFGLGIATVALGAGIVLVPSITAAAYVRHLGNLVKDARSAHVIEWAPTADGGRKRVREMWYEDGRWRVEAPIFGTVTIADAQKRWVYNSERKSVMVSSLASPFMGGSGFTLSSMLSDRRLGKVQVEDGNRYKAVRIENPIDHSTVVMWVDKKTDYPVRGQVQASTPNGPRTTLSFECEFNGDVADQRFATSFPAGTKVIDTVGGERFWQKELSKPLAQFKTDGPAGRGKVVLRNVQATERGDVFVLYNGDINADDIEISDDIGNVYVKCEGFQPQAYRMNPDTGTPEPTEGLRVGGSDLRGGWWTPLTPSKSKWQPRTLRLSFTSVWYKADPEKIKRLPKHASVSIKDMQEMRTAIGQWSSRIDEPTCGLTPDYMPFMGMGPGSDFDVLRQEEEARSKYLLAHERFAEAEPILRDEIGRIEEYEAKTGQTWVKSSYFYEMYRALKAIGKLGEAREWLGRVQNEPGGARGDARIEQALSIERL